jgi:hypothetical protein
LRLEPTSQVHDTSGGLFSSRSGALVSSRGRDRMSRSGEDRSASRRPLCAARRSGVRSPRRCVVFVRWWNVTSVNNRASAADWHRCRPGCQRRRVCDAGWPPNSPFTTCVYASQSELGEPIIRKAGAPPEFACRQASPGRAADRFLWVVGPPEVSRTAQRPVEGTRPSAGCRLSLHRDLVKSAALA